MTQLEEKHRIMNLLANILVCIVIGVYFLHEFTNLFRSNQGTHQHIIDSKTVLFVLLIVPILLQLITIIISRKKERYLKHIPLLHTFILTLSSISIMALGGLTEYHFSIFMVIAILAYYESIRLVIISTTIFTLHHVIGFIVDPRLLGGSDSFNFPILVLHAFFLLLTSGATILQIRNKQRYQEVAEKDREENQLKFTQIHKKLEASVKTTLKTTYDLVQSINITKASADEIASTSMEVAVRSERQAFASNENTKVMNEMIKGVNRVSENSTVVLKSSKETVKETKAGEEAIQQAMKQMDYIHISVDGLSSTISQLDLKVQEIGSILKVITDITEQTNLLALNAAIEAARAGEHGKGFAVVASEVRKLAENSKTSASKIESLILEIQSKTTEAKVAMKQGVKEVEVGISSVQRTGNSLKGILDNAEEVSKQIQETNIVIDELTASFHSLSEIINEIAELSNLNSLQTSSVKNYTNEQYSSIIQIEKVADELQKMSNELESLVNQVKSE